MKTEIHEQQELSNTEVQKNTPPRKKKPDIVWIFDILGTVVALIAAIISLVTLREMKIQRNNAYMPTIVFETAKVGTDATQFGIDFSDDTYDNITFLTRNIGVGVAKKLTYALDSSNYVRWLEFYNTLNPEDPYTYEIKGDVFSVTMDGQKIGFPAKETREKLFLLPNAEESYNFVLPSEYTVLLYEIYKHAKTWELDIPDLEVEVSYSDVQNVQYKEIIRLSVRTFLLSNTSERKVVAFEIYMK